jgi:hypothetical protein
MLASLPRMNSNSKHILEKLIAKKRIKKNSRNAELRVPIVVRLSADARRRA